VVVVVVVVVVIYLSWLPVDLTTNTISALLFSTTHLATVGSKELLHSWFSSTIHPDPSSSSRCGVTTRRSQKRHQPRKIRKRRV